MCGKSMIENIPSSLRRNPKVVFSWLSRQKEAFKPLRLESAVDPSCLLVVQFGSVKKIRLKESLSRVSVYVLGIFNC